MVSAGRVSGVCLGCAARQPATAIPRPVGPCDDRPGNPIHRSPSCHCILRSQSWASGFVAGMVAKRIVPGMDREGLVLTTLLGVAGALLGGYIATKLFNVDGIQGFFDISTWITAIAGAGLVLLAYHAVAGQGSSRRGGRLLGRR